MPKRKGKKNGTCKYQKKKKMPNTVWKTLALQSLCCSQTVWYNTLDWDRGYGFKSQFETPRLHCFTAIQSFNKIIWWLIMMYIKLSLAATKLSLVVHHYKPEYLVCLQPKIKDQQFEDIAETILFSLTILFWLSEPLTLKTDQFLDRPISMHDTSTHNDASSFQVCLQKAQQLRKYNLDEHSLKSDVWMWPWPGPGVRKVDASSARYLCLALGLRDFPPRFLSCF